jgi:hypothetical protein
MSNEKHSQIEQRAREIWQREGCPDGRAEAHWKQAEEELARESEQAAPSTGAAPYVPGEGPMIEPDVGSPVIAGVSATSTPPIPAEEVEERKRAAKAKPAAVAKSAAAPARPGATKTAEPAKAESKPAPSKPAADTKKATKKKG